MATVYRTISLLKELGEVLELAFSNDSNRYDGNNPYPHPHLICLRCKMIVDPNVNNLAVVTHKLSSET